MRNFTLTAASVVVALLVLELMLHAFPSLLPIPLRPETREFLVSHPVIGFAVKPAASGVMRSLDYEVSWQVDHDGFRNEDTRVPRADAVVIGDSLVFGDGVEVDDAWPQLLARLSGLRTVNLGLSGASPQQYLSIYRIYGRPLQPKIVLAGFFGTNDFEGAELYERWVDSGFGGNYKDWSNYGRPTTGGLLGHVQLAVSKHVLLTQVARFALRALRRRSSAGNDSLSLPWHDGTEMLLDERSLLENAPKAVPDGKAYTYVLDALTSMNDEAVAAGSRFVVVFLPGKEEIYLPFLGRPAPSLSAAIISALEQRGIPTIDLTPAFRARAETGERLFFPTDGHPNAAGYRLIAEQVANWLARDEAHGNDPDG